MENRDQSREEIKAEKKILRAKIKNAIDLMTEEQRKKESDACFKMIIESKEFLEADAVLSYMATEREISADKICMKAMEEGKILALPRTVPGTRLMDFYVVDEKKNLDEQLEKGMWEIREPKKTLPIFSAKKISEEKKCGCKILVINPGVAFTKDGTRLGHGKGFYDIYLKKLISECAESKCALSLMGLCFSTQLLPRIPSSDHDVKMDSVMCLDNVT